MKNDFVMHTDASAPEASRPLLDDVRAAWGFVPNLHTVLAESPAALEAYGTLWAIFERTSLTPVERNVAYLAIIYENGCEYCMAGHTGLSRRAHVPEEAIAAVRDGRPLADARLEALRRFAALVTRQRGEVAPTDVAAFKAAGYDNRAVLDVLVGAATKLISNYANHLAETPNDAFMAGLEWSRPAAQRAAA
ncbi:carboxymuconolactone decarboxylase family protein [Acuticoccus sp.]|uniref:carboxymuconolactone decarboxylase family protein n=1 Tax=Acuticoccus sp. TaxID=1904378 RepID=UPI003B52A8FD